MMPLSPLIPWTTRRSGNSGISGIIFRNFSTDAPTTRVLDHKGYLGLLVIAVTAVTRGRTSWGTRSSPRQRVRALTDAF